jgi:predicted AlkP superfamily phosphohydrolase/phosphomutase
LRRHLLAAPGRVAEAAEHLLARERFDLAWLTFSAAHLAGHQFWDLSQMDDRAADPKTRAVLGRTLEEAYEAVDSALGRVVAALPPGTDVIITSPVGMDVNTSRADLLPEMLEAVLRGGRAPDRAPGFVWRLRGSVPAEARRLVANTLPDALALELASRLELRGMDWSLTRAFAQPADNQGYVRLNLRGRERDGAVDPGEADALCEEIATGLSTFTDPDGAPAIRSVERTADCFDRGGGIDRLPDLVVHWSDRPATRLGEVASPHFGRVRRRGGASGRAGNHTAGDAWALTLPAAARHAEPTRPPRLVDVAATVRSLLAGDRAEPGAGEPLMVR